MTTTAKYADALLRERGHGGLYEWAMIQRARVRPPSYEEVAVLLRHATGGEVEIGGQMLRRWLLQLEIEREVTDRD